MNKLEQQFEVPFQYGITFTRHLFSPSNDTLINLLYSSGKHKRAVRTAIVIDEGVATSHHDVLNQIHDYYLHHLDRIVCPVRPLILEGGEQCKNSFDGVTKVLQLIESAKIDRHSYLIVIGGGAMLDMAGFAAAIAHRGVRLIRIPTTVLAQNDSGVGVKNSVNFFNKKNFLGTFAPPYAVVNDSFFLKTLNDRDWRSGISEAIKVALIKDSEFFEWVENNSSSLNNRDLDAMEYLVCQCANLHTMHIATSGDPFEKGSSRPLDFGHWAAHKLEQLTNYELRHGEAVAIGLALDVSYSYYAGLISVSTRDRVLNVLQSLGFELFHPLLEHEWNSETINPEIISGLEEFREHLGGDLTIMLLKEIGQGIEVNEMHHAWIEQSALFLKQYKSKSILQFSC